MLRLLIAAALAVSALAAAAREQIPAEKRIWPYSATVEYVPACNDPIVQRTLRRHFRQAERSYWNTGLAIAEVVEIRETAWRPNGLDLIPRRFCRGIALMSDNRRRAVDFSVIEEAGIIGLSWGIQWCVHGLDRHNTYAPGCLMARP